MRTINENRPENDSKPWSEKDDQTLVDLIERGAPVEMIAQLLGRTVRGIENRGYKQFGYVVKKGYLIKPEPKPETGCSCNGNGNGNGHRSDKVLTELLAELKDMNFYLQEIVQFQRASFLLQQEWYQRQFGLTDKPAREIAKQVEQAEIIQA